VFAQQEVTIVHSGSCLGYTSVSASFQKRLAKKVAAMGIKVILGEKIEDFESVTASTKSFKTDKGTVIEADYFVKAIGNGTPNSEFLDAAWLNDKKEVKVLPTLQAESHSHVFSLGDVAATGSAKMAFKINDRMSFSFFYFALFLSLPWT
jgi:NADH dehydrogenase FAD-containing subunit